MASNRPAHPVSQFDPIAMEDTHQRAIFSIGEALSGERRRQGLSLFDIASETNINRHFLEAIEANHFEQLPGALLGRSFVRQYARTLGLDGEKLVTALLQHVVPETAPLLEPLQPPAQPARRRLPDKVLARSRSSSLLSDLAWLLVILLGWAGVDTFWQRTPATPSTTRTAALSGSPTKQSLLVETTGSLPSLDKSGSSPALRVGFAASEPVWLSIKSDGRLAYTGTLDAQQSQQFEASSTILVLVGNAGGIEISLNGKPIGPLGRHAEVRLLQLSAEGVRVLQHTPPATSPDLEDPT
jgi:cytoskeletal protein RodZ